MSKVLKAFWKIAASHEIMCGHTNPTWEEEIDIVKLALTPPTEEKVCELLQDFLGIDKVHYGENSFYSESPKGIQDIICSYYINDNGEEVMYFFEGLTPELTIEVCKFFKDEDNDDDDWDDDHWGDDDDWGELECGCWYGWGCICDEDEEEMNE